MFDLLGKDPEITAEWFDHQNKIRPHEAPGSLRPARYREQWLAAILQFELPARQGLTISYPAAIGAVSNNKRRMSGDTLNTTPFEMPLD